MTDNKTRIVITAKDETRAAIQSAMGGLQSITSAAARLPLIGTALAGAFSGAALTAGVKSAIDGADQLAKASQKYGVAVEQLSALSYAGKLADVSLEAIGTGLKKLSTNMADTAAGTGEARDAFKALGISVKETDGSLKSSDAVLAEIADRFAGMEDGAGKTALAVKLFGRAGADLIPLLNQGSKGLRDMKKEAEQLGAIVGGDLGRASEQFNDNLTRLGAAADAFKIAIAQQVLPALNNFTDAMVAAHKATGNFLSAFRLLGGSDAGNPVAALEAVETRLAKLRKLQAEIQNSSANKSILRDLPFIGTAGDLANLEKQIKFAEQQRVALLDLSNRRGAFDFGPPVWQTKTKPPAPYGESAIKKAADDSRRARQEAARAFEEDMRNTLALIQTKERLKDSYVDMIEPAAHTMRELRKFEEVAPAIGLTAEQIERIRDAFQEKIDFEQYGKPLKDITEEIRKQDDLAKDLGLTFSSAFEDAVIAGKKFSDVLKGLAQDIARIVLRRTVTEPLGNALSGMLKDVLPSFGGGKASGGAVYPGQYYVVGEKGPEVLLPNTSGTVVPNGALGGVTNNSVSIVVHADGGSRVQSDAAQGAELGRRLDAAVRGVLMAEMRPGGLLTGA